MAKGFRGSLRSLSSKVTPSVSLVAIMAGALALVGWVWDLDTIRRILPGTVSMNPLTAIAFMVGGFSLWMHGTEAPQRPKFWPEALALLVLMIGFWRLMGYVFEWEVGIDQWLFAEKLATDLAGQPNRMSPNAALNFVFLGCGLLLMNRTSRRGVRLTEVFAILLGFVSLLALLGYVYQVSWLYGVVSFIPMALPTAVVFHLLAIGLLLARRDQGWVRLVLSESPGGSLVRHLLPILLPALVLLGWLRLAGERHGFFEAEMGTTLYTVMAILIVWGLIWWSARSLHRADKSRRRVEDELERFFSLSLDMLCICGRDGRFKRINHAFSEILGYPIEELMQNPFMDYVHPEDLERTLREVEKINAGEPSMHFENRYRCKDGSYRWLWWKSHYLAEGGLIYATARDVTEQKQVQEDIRQLNETLQERATQLDASNQELEAFSYSVSHDLRAPLRGISGFAQALEEHSKAVLDETAQSYLLRVRRAADRMGYLIDDLLKLSRLTRAEMHLEPVNLSHQAEAILAQLKQRDPQRQVEWVVQPEVVVTADAALMHVLLENLLENAWKFTSKNPKARIEVGQLSVPAGEKICHVRDNGVGFDMRYATKLFGAFQRLHSMVEFPGTGIGLATVQRVVRRHGGRVWADSELNVGSTFFFVV